METNGNGKWHRVMAIPHPIACCDEEYLVAVESRLCDDGLWVGRLVYTAHDGRQHITAEETTQPDREAVIFWATALEPVYLATAFERAAEPPALEVI